MPLSQWFCCTASANALVLVPAQGERLASLYESA
jgi:hypothetical protein